MAFTNDRPNQRHYALNLVSRASGGAEGPADGYSSTATGSVTGTSLGYSFTRNGSTTRVSSLNAIEKQTVSNDLQVFNDISSTSFSNNFEGVNSYSRESSNTYSIFRSSSNTRTNGFSSYTFGNEGRSGDTGDANTNGGTDGGGITSKGSTDIVNGNNSYSSTTRTKSLFGSRYDTFSRTGRRRTGTDSDGNPEYEITRTNGFFSSRRTETSSFLSVASRVNYSIVSTTSSSASQWTNFTQDQDGASNVIGPLDSDSSSSTVSSPINGITQGTATSTYEDDMQFFSRDTSSVELTRTYTTTQGILTGTGSYTFESSVTIYGGPLTVTLPTISRESVSSINSRLNLLSYNTVIGGGAYLTGGNTLQNYEVIGASRTTSASRDALPNNSYNTYSFNLAIGYPEIGVNDLESEFVSTATVTGFTTRPGTRVTRVSTTPTYDSFDFGLKTVNSITYVTETYASGIGTTTTGNGRNSTLKQTRSLKGKVVTLVGSTYVPTVLSSIYIVGDTTSEYTIDGLDRVYNTTFTTVKGRPGDSFSTSGGGFTRSELVDRPGYETATGFARADNINRHVYYTLGKAGNGGLHYESELKASNNIDDFGGISITCDRVVLTTYTLTVPTNATNTDGTDVRISNETLGTISYESDGLPLGIRLSAFSGVEFLPTNSNWFIMDTGPGYQLTISHYSNRTSSMSAKISSSISFSSSDGVPTTVSTNFGATGSIKVNAGSPFNQGQSKQYYSTRVQPNLFAERAVIIHGDDFADAAAFYTHANTDQLYNFTANSAGSTGISTNTVTNSIGTSSRSLPKNAMLFINSTTKAQPSGSPSIVYNAQLD